MASRVPGYPKHIVVLIRLLRTKGGVPDDIRVYPAARKSNLIYATWRGNAPDPTLPHSVRWIADGLWPGETLKIEPSPKKMRPRIAKWPRGWKGPFEQGIKSVRGAPDVLSSGPATFPPGWGKRLRKGKHKGLRWHYSVTWTADEVEVKLDPPIIIVPDP